MTDVTPINQATDPNRIEARLLQDRIEKHHNEKIEQQERVREKRLLDKRMLQAYYERLDRLATYNAQAQLNRARAELGRLIDITIE
jgi:hypothetical protein|tara:strand:+ start:84 stop:341 length:258 start_codon:yes stop_codon:yes gene_type:complete